MRDEKLLLAHDGTYRGFTLDPFQLEAIEYIEQGYSVLVSAPTGVGKTLIADYVIEKNYREGKQVIYTAPIKALSNQKFKEFKRLLGPEAVGILTGDLVINQDAPILIMTTEIFRNLLHADLHRVADVAYVIFDEIHYIDDADRGSVWEESLIFMPPQMRFLGLSATIPNVSELAGWIGEIQNQDIKIVYHHQRAVPLEHHLYEKERGLCSRKQLLKYFRRLVKKDRIGDVEATTHRDLVEYIGPGYFPALFFMFSRRRCEESAWELSQTNDYLEPGEKEHIRQIAMAIAERYPAGGVSRVRNLLSLWQKGIAFHHAGLMPVVKDVVEELFEKRLLKIIYCTETFAVGLNFPCRTVCFESLTKWDGHTFRPLANREYFQMAGRAGRRGIDEEGFVFSVINLTYFRPDELPSLREQDVEPLRSRFSLAYNTVLNLVQNYRPEEIERILQQNFASYQNKAQRERWQRELQEIEARQEAEYCAARWKPECPVDDRRLRSRLQRKQERLAALGGTRRERRERHILQREIAQLEKQLRGSRKKCSPEQIRHCRSQMRTWQIEERQLRRLQRRLAEMQAPDYYLQEFQMKKEFLQALDYLRDDELTARGLFASRIYVQELLVTELFFEGFFHELTPDQINALVVGIDYEPRRNELRHPQNFINLTPVMKIIKYLSSMEDSFTELNTVRFHDHLVGAAYRWSQGASFNELLQGVGVEEGDLVYGLRRGIDLLRQIRAAAGEDKSLVAKLQGCIEKMDRDEVAIVL
ncbi:MAG: DEAD/DEAH box helicase [Limnochordia bacterium]